MTTLCYISSKFIKLFSCSCNTLAAVVVATRKKPAGLWFCNLANSKRVQVKITRLFFAPKIVDVWPHLSENEDA